MSERQSEQVRLPLANGLALRGQVSFPVQPGPAAVLFIHGYTSRRDGTKAQAVEAMCAGWGWTFAAFDFRGHGDSDGTLSDLSGSALQEDLEAIRAYLAERGIQQLFLVGSSMGGWASAWFAVTHPGVVPACAVIAPAFSFPRYHWERLTQDEQRDWRARRRVAVQNVSRGSNEFLNFALIEEMDRYPLEALIERWAAPLLIFHGMQDDVVPYSGSIYFVERAAHPEMELCLLKNGDHRLHTFRDEMARQMGDFFARWWPD
jgi:pimeloyl-ACP methyl ester carboxylesterase